MKTLAGLALWICILAVAAFAMAVGIGGMVFLPSALDAVMAFALASCATVLGAVAMGRFVDVAADDVKLDLLIDWFRVRNWRRRRAWRPYAAALAGESTAASCMPAAYR
jgi:hypothetical protein